MSIALKKLLLVFALLLPSIAAWIYGSMFFLPYLQGMWAQEGDSVRGFFGAERNLFVNGWLAIPALGVLILLNYLIYGKRPGVYSVVLGTLFWITNAAVLVGLIFMALSGVVVGQGDHRDVAFEVFGSDKGLVEMVSSRVVAVRLHSKDGAAFFLNDYMRGEEVLLTPGQATHLKTVLLRQSTYDWDSSVACAANYGVVFVFQDASPPIELALCFSCSQFAVYRDGKDISSQSLMRMGPFLALAKELFPNDQDLQSLDETKD